MDTDRKSQTEMTELSPGPHKTHYGTSENVTRSVDNQKNNDGKPVDGKAGCYNLGYQGNDDYLK